MANFLPSLPLPSPHPLANELHAVSLAHVESVELLTQLLNIYGVRGWVGAGGGAGRHETRDGKYAAAGAAMDTSVAAEQHTFVRCEVE